MAAITSSVIGGVGLAAGAIKGFRGTPDQQVFQQTTLDKKSKAQQGLEKDSMEAFRAQQGLAGDYEQGIGAVDAMRDPAIQAYLDQISGKAFQNTPEELAQIQTLRDAMVRLGAQDVDQFTTQGLNQATSGAAARGLRGQAMGQLRGQVLEEGARQVGGISNQANLFAAQQAINQPFQRVAAQQQALQTGLNQGDMMRLQAQQNRQALQSPFLLQQMQQERLATGRTTNMAPGQKGGIMGGILGGIAGGASGLSSASNIMGGLQGMGLLGGGGQQQQAPQQMAQNYQGFNPYKMMG